MNIEDYLDQTGNIQHVLFNKCYSNALDFHTSMRMYNSEYLRLEHKKYPEDNRRYLAYQYVCTNYIKEE